MIGLGSDKNAEKCTAQAQANTPGECIQMWNM